MEQCILPRMGETMLRVKIKHDYSESAINRELEEINKAGYKIVSITMTDSDACLIVYDISGGQ